MQFLKQSTAFTDTIGPILDSTGAEYTGAVIGDLSISKNGTEAAMAAAATLTHVSNGHYTLVGTTGNTDTLGRLTIRCNKSTYQLQTKEYMVLASAVFDTLITNGTLASTTSGRTIVTDAAGLVDANVVKLGPTGSGTAQTARDIGASVLLSSGTGTGQLNFTSGVVQSQLADAVSHGGTLGSSTATLALSRMSVVSQSSNTNALTVTGNGTGHGAALTSGSGATGNALTLLAASTNGHGLKSTGTGTGDGAELTAGASGADLDADIAGTITTATNVTTVNGLAAGVITSAAFAAGAINNAAMSIDGSELTAIPWNASWDAEVQSEVDDALIAKGLDHLVFTSVTGTDIADNSIIAYLASKSATADWDSYVNTTDSLEASRDNIGTAGAGLTAADDAVITAIAALNNLSQAQAQSASESALQTYHLDHLIAVADPGGVVANSSFLAKLTSKSATPAFSSYDNTTDSLEAIRDNTGTAGAGLTAIPWNASWDAEVQSEVNDALVAYAVSTLAAGDVWAVPTRTLTSAVNITSTGGTVPITAGNLVSADVTAISTDTVAADNLEAEYDGTGYTNYLRIGTAQNGTSSAIVLDSGANSTIDDYYVPCIVTILSGKGARQGPRLSYLYTASSRLLRVRPDWAEQPDNTSVFALHPYGPVSVRNWQNNAAPALTGSGYIPVQVFGIENDVLTAAALASDAVAEIQSGLATAANLATLQTSVNTIDDFLDTEMAATLAAVDTEVASIKSVTDKLDTAMELDGSVYRFTTNALELAPAGGGGGGDPWSTALPGAYGAGTAGYIVGNLNTTIPTNVDTTLSASHGSGSWVGISVIPENGSINIVNLAVKGKPMEIERGSEYLIEDGLSAYWFLRGTFTMTLSDTVVMDMEPKGGGTVTQIVGQVTDVTTRRIDFEFTAAQTTALAVKEYDCQVFLTQFGETDPIGPVVKVKANVTSRAT